jgi:hypothetical protein
MVISKLAKKKEKQWIAGAFCFSGRPDPTWPVNNKKLVKQLEKIWNSLEPLSDEIPPSPPILGYRGCFVRDNNSHREWAVYNKAVTLEIDGGNSETRLDRQGTFEKLVLSSAPKGVLPAFCFKQQQ